MSEKNRGAITMHLSDGEVFSVWERLSIRESFLDPLGSYSFTVAPPRDQLSYYRGRLVKGEQVKIRINGKPLASPLIQTRDLEVSKQGGVRINVQCQSALVTPYQGGVDPGISKTFPADVPVSGAVLDALAIYGFDTLVGDATAHVNALTGKTIGGRGTGISVPTLKHRDIQANEGEMAYGFCSRLFARLGALLACDHEGKLLLRAPDYDQEPAYTLVQDFDQSRTGDRFVGDVQVHDSNDGLFSEVVVRGHGTEVKGKKYTSQPSARVAISGQTRPSDAPFGEIPETTLDSGPRRYVSTAAPYKPAFKLDKDARDAERCRNVATVLHSLGLANAYYVRGQVDGCISETGRVWTPDTIADVYVEADEIDEPMWVLERAIDVDKRGGQLTTLKLLQKHALQLGEVAS